MLDSIPSLIEKTFPIPGRFKSKLPSDIAELSRLLTNNRGSRSLSYLTRPNFLSAYLYYFFPCNLYRLCLLLPSLNLNLKADNLITDLGSGPLTFTSALWISRPELRNLPLEFNCVDRSTPVLEAGKKFFAALCESFDCKNVLWKINLIKEDVDIRQVKNAKKRKSASLVCAVNMFNEIYENLSHNNAEGLRQMAKNAAQTMHNEAAKNASILTVEPGVPQSGKFISLLRYALMELGHPPSSPCTHTKTCPLSIISSAKTLKGRNWIDTKKRWCHFAYETIDAPKELRRLSADAKLPKERLVFSFLLTGQPSAQLTAKTTEARVISDAFPLPYNRYGRYACCERGLILIQGEKERIENAVSGSTVQISATGQHDKKSGAMISAL
ncbi:MAG: small ribosomal subunit Rsm22 family protein [Treponema sp.]|jgi:ribosomal protein RSM22 (predicted rRNA methylase)|nr:small ribosomal subunit Rsm22 family protein [Treponema sp.]